MSDHASRQDVAAEPRCAAPLRLGSVSAALTSAARSCSRSSGVNIAGILQRCLSHGSLFSRVAARCGTIVRLRLPVQTVDATPSAIKAAFKGGVYEARETVWAFRGAEDRRVASLEGGADVA